MSHTPGPWYFVNYGGFVQLQIKDEYPSTLKEKTNLLDEDHYANAEDNGKLAACAPEMIEMIEKLQNQLTHLILITPSGEYRNKLTDLNIETLALIKKATL